MDSDDIEWNLTTLNGMWSCTEHVNSCCLRCPWGLSFLSLLPGISPRLAVDSTVRCVRSLDLLLSA